jgi:hypothetical protein
VKIVIAGSLPEKSGGTAGMRTTLATIWCKQNMGTPSGGVQCQHPPESVLALHIEESSQAPRKRAFQHTVKVKLEAAAGSLI